MSFRKFMFHGIESDLKRENHPVDTVKAQKSSFDYSGKVTEEYFKDGKKLVVVDGALQISITKPHERKEIQSTLSGYKMKANMTAAGGVGGIGYSIYRIAFGDYAYGALGVLASLAVTGWGLGRAKQAQVERIKWDEPIQQVCDTRRTAALSFKNLMSNDLKGSHFTHDETQDVFHQSMLQLGSEYTKQLTKSNPKTMQTWVNRFSDENPIHTHALKYAFKDQAILQNPRYPENGYWKREDLDKLTEKSRKLSTELTSFHAETEQQLQEIYNRQALGNAAIQSTNFLAHTLMDRNANIHLYKNKREKQARLRELPSHGSPAELQRKAREIEDAHELSADQAKSSAEQNKLTSSTTAFAAGTLSDVFAATQRGTLFANRRNEFMKQFPSQAGDILEGYYSAKQPGIKQ